MRRIIPVFFLIITAIFLSCDNAPDLAHEIERYQDEGNGRDGIMLNFGFMLDKEYPAGINDYSINGLVPYGTDRSNLVAHFKTTGYIDVFVDGVPQLSGVTENDFTKPVVYRLVDVKDDSFVEYTVTIKNAPNSEAVLYALSLKIGEKTYTCTVDNTLALAYVPYGTDLSTVSLGYTLSDNAWIDIHNEAYTKGNSIDLSNDLVLKVKAENGEVERNYTLIIKYEKHTKAELTSFLLNTASEIYNCPIDGDHIETNVKYGTVLTNIIPKFTLSYGAKLYDKNGSEILSGETPVTFTKGELTYFTVVSEDGAVNNEYTVLINELPNHEANIEEFYLEINNARYIGNIDGNSISISIPHSTIFSENIGQYAKYRLSSGANLYIFSDQIKVEDVNNYIIKLFYRVMSSDGLSDKDYTVHVAIAKNTDSVLQNFELKFSNGNATCNEPTGNNIACVSQFNADLSNGTAYLTVPYGAIVYMNDIQLNYDIGIGKYVYSGNFSSPIIFRVESENTINNNLYTITTELGCLNLTPEVDITANSYYSNIDSTNYGLGLFSTNNIPLKNKCGYDLDYNLNDDFDINNNGSMNDGKSLRITVNGKNIKDPSFSGGFNLVSKDLTTLSMPHNNNCFIDKTEGIFILPGPIFSHLFNNPDSLFSIYSNYTRDFKIITATQNYAYDGFEDGAYVLTAAAADSGLEGHEIIAHFFPFGNNSIPASNGTLALDFSNTFMEYSEYSVIVKVIDMSNFNGFVFEAYNQVSMRFSTSYTELSFMSGGGTLTGNNSRTEKRFYLVWNESGNLKVYLFDSLLFDSNNSPAFNNIHVSVEMKVKIGNNSMNFGKSAKLALHTFKLWNEALSTDVNWMQSSIDETSVHPIYGMDNNFKINDINVSYYKNE